MPRKNLSGSAQVLCGSFRERFDRWSVSVLSEKSKADTFGEESALFFLLFLFNVVGLTKPSKHNIFSLWTSAPSLSRTHLTGALSSRALKRLSVFTGAGGVAVGKGLLCNFSARGRAGAIEAKPPASDRVGAAAPGHGGGACADGRGGCAAACIQGSVAGSPGG